MEFAKRKIINSIKLKEIKGAIRLDSKTAGGYFDTQKINIKFQSVNLIDFRIK